MRRALVLACLLTVLAAPAAAPAALPPVRHVFVIVLENKDFDESFGPHSVAPYLATQLTARGALLTQYFGTSHQSLGNYLSMISGQAPNPTTQGDCPIFVDVVPGTLVGDGQALGQGCVYPKRVPTLADQLDARGLTWRGYMQSMTRACRHPAIGMPDDTERARVGDQYAVRHDPFVYFHSIIDDGARCQRGVVDLRALPGDLANVATTPNLSFITPDLCEDGHDEPCVDGRPGGLRSADEFLKAWVPAILASPAFRADGLLVVTWDEANFEDSDACCDEPMGVNTPTPGVTGPGGGRTGTVVVSPFVAPGTRSEQTYNHYALLRTIEDLFGLGHLGYAAQQGLRPFGDDVFTRPGGTAASAAAGARRAAATRHCHTRVFVQRKRGGRTYLLIRSPRPGTVRGRKLRRCKAIDLRVRGRHGVVRLRLPGARKARTVRY
jgi:phosphatidylinositol-3-phosphatase